MDNVDVVAGRDLKQFSDDYSQFVLRNLQITLNYTKFDKIFVELKIIQNKEQGIDMIEIFRSGIEQVSNDIDPVDALVHGLSNTESLKKLFDSKAYADLNRKSQRLDRFVQGYISAFPEKLHPEIREHFQSSCIFSVRGLTSLFMSNDQFSEPLYEQLSQILPPPAKSVFKAMVCCDGIV